MKRVLRRLGVLLILVVWSTVRMIETVQLVTLDVQAEQLTRSVRLQYPRITPGECPLWDRIRYECEEEYRD